MLYYSDERNVQILVALLKAYGISRVIASPGTTNINFVWSVQRDSYFKVFSAVDERHAAYLACGMAYETDEPVVITCTGATASRNYFPGLTEAYYRNLPILAVTASQRFVSAGNLSPQFVDRTKQPKDTVRMSLQCKVPLDKVEESACELEINRALTALRRRGGGPVHINLETSYSGSFGTEKLPSVRYIQHVDERTKIWPDIPLRKRIAIWIGSHKKFSGSELDAIEAFVKSHDCVVLTDKTSSYHGVGAVDSSFLASQDLWNNPEYQDLPPEHVIYIGSISGDYPTKELCVKSQSVWRVSNDGEMVDVTGKLTAVYEMPEEIFFKHYSSETKGSLEYSKRWIRKEAALRERIPELPFSNVWIAKQLCSRLSEGSALHLGILNSLRSWNLFPVAKDVDTVCNVGGFGIDGIISTAIGAALANPLKIFFVVVGDLAFFYDLNALGNRHVGKNLRILLINNAAGAEFHLSSHSAYKFGKERSFYMAADRHFGNKSRNLVKHYAQDLGLTYLTADSKDSFEQACEKFLAQSSTSIIFECFTTTEDESAAQQLMTSLIPQAVSLRSVASKILPSGVKSIMRKVVR